MNIITWQWRGESGHPDIETDSLNYKQLFQPPLLHHTPCQLHLVMISWLQTDVLRVSTLETDSDWWVHQRWVRAMLKPGNNSVKHVYVCTFQNWVRFFWILEFSLYFETWIPMAMCNTHQSCLPVCFPSLKIRQSVTVSFCLSVSFMFGSFRVNI